MRELLSNSGLYSKVSSSSFSSLSCRHWLIVMIVMIIAIPSPSWLSWLSLSGVCWACTEAAAEEWGQNIKYENTTLNIFSLYQTSLNFKGFKTKFNLICLWKNVALKQSDHVKIYLFHAAKCGGEILNVLNVIEAFLWFVVVAKIQWRLFKCLCSRCRRICLNSMSRRSFHIWGLFEMITNLKYFLANVISNIHPINH